MCLLLTHLVITAPPYTLPKQHLTIYTLENGAHYLNVDISTPEKIEKAKDLGLGSSGVADVLLTRYLYHAADLFQNTSRTGRCFTILRHPVERAVAMFHTLRTKGKLGNNRTLEEYADSEAEDNWMTRMITNQMEGALSRKHFDVAREVCVDSLLVYTLYCICRHCFNAYDFIVKKLSSIQPSRCLEESVWSD